MVLVFLDGKMVGEASEELQKAALGNLGLVEAYGMFDGTSTTWHPPAPGMREAGVTKLVRLQGVKPA